ncbi:hypothetical protein D5086_030983 [Populus alba]|uniref:Uncharacterized protein n=1 Tax=Populus alba TaxID=43335 RepID=A0ACC4AQ06_POPAL
MTSSEKETQLAEEIVIQIDEDETIISHPVDVAGVVGNGDMKNDPVDNSVLVTNRNGERRVEHLRLQLESDNLDGEAASEKTASSSSSYRTLYSPMWLP